MKKSFLCLVAVLVLCLTVGLTSCNKEDKTIYVCASELPHADVLENAVAPILKEKGYTLKVTVLDWTIQNDSVANKDYDANYFQHVPYLTDFNQQNGTNVVSVSAIHVEPLGIYGGIPWNTRNPPLSLSLARSRSCSHCCFPLQLI